VYPVTDDCVIQSNLTMKDEGNFRLEVKKGLLPPTGSPATHIIKVK
jgi:hypothetical protein